MQRFLIDSLRRTVAPHRGYVLLFLLAVLVRLVYALLIHPDGLIWADETTYDRIAWQLTRSGRYLSHPYDATPGWPAVLALTYKLFGHDYAAARATQAILGGVLVLAVAGTGALFFDRQVGCLAGLITALYPPLIYLAAVLYADHLAATLLAASTCSLAWWHRRRTVAPLFLAGVLLGATALTRPAYLLLLPIAAVYIASEAAAGQRIRHTALFCAIAASTIAPWTLRNAVVFNHFVPVSTGFGLHLWAGNNEVALGNADDRHLRPLNDLWAQRAAALPAESRAALSTGARQLVQELAKLDAVQQDGRLRVEAWEWIRAHPTRFAGLAARRVLTLYAPFSHTTTRNDARSARNVMIAALSLIPILALGVPGVLLAVRRRRGSWIVIAVILTPTLLYALLTAATRVRLPIDTMWILLASVTVVTVLARLVNDPRARGIRARWRTGTQCTV